MKVRRALLIGVTALLLLSGVRAEADWKWTIAANTMSDQRWAPSYCLLADGSTALIAAGYSFQFGWCVPSADLFSEKTKRFVKLSARLHTPRDFAPATLLPDGTVLIAGGFNDSFGSLNSAELYDPTQQSFTLLDQHMLSPRELHTATLLMNGTVLIVGGLNLTIGHTQNTAEIYDPSTHTFSPAGGLMNNDRFGHAACLLSDGRVLVVGGTSAKFGSGGYANVLATAEIYDPVTRTFTLTKGPMTVGRDRPTANLLPNGMVLIAGGQGAGGDAINYAEIFDPSTGLFTEIKNPQITARMAHNTSRLPNGNFLMTGGWCSTAHATTSSVEEFDANKQTFTREPDLPFASHDAAQVVFSDGCVLVAGGKTASSDGASDGINGGAWAVVNY